MDLLTVERGLVVAPAGCGKTELISEALRRHVRPRPILVLTHTHAGVAALRGRLDRAGVRRQAYRLSTVDGWAMRLISTFPVRAGHDPAIVEGLRPSYPAIRESAARLLLGSHIDDVIGASYDRLIVDEYQDCSGLQHAIVASLANLLPTAVLGDPMQAIFGFDPADPLADWDVGVCGHFPLAATLEKPWRWIRAGADDLGQWLLYVRSELQKGRTIDVRGAPDMTWVPLDGTGGDHVRRLKAGLVKSPVRDGSVLIIGDSRRPWDQRAFASQTPGAVTVEAVDLQDLVTFARDLDLAADNAVAATVGFAESVMTNVGSSDLLRRLDTLRGGRSRKEPTEAETAALGLETDRRHERVLDVLSVINRQPGVRVYRPSVYRACTQALRECCGEGGGHFHAAALRMREEHRLLGRELPRRAVGSTLLLKGLEADVAVLLSADEMDARHLYVALTRGARKVVVCSRSPTLGSGRRASRS